MHGSTFDRTDLKWSQSAPFCPLQIVVLLLQLPHVLLQLVFYPFNLRQLRFQFVNLSKQIVIRTLTSSEKTQLSTLFYSYSRRRIQNNLDKLCVPENGIPYCTAPTCPSTARSPSGACWTGTWGPCSSSLPAPAEPRVRPQAPGSLPKIEIKNSFANFAKKVGNCTVLFFFMLTVYCHLKLIQFVPGIPCSLSPFSCLCFPICSLLKLNFKQILLRCLVSESESTVYQSIKNSLSRYTTKNTT